LRQADCDLCEKAPAETTSRAAPWAKAQTTLRPEDNKFLECSEETEADYLVTRNKRHFSQRWGKTRVVNARQFVDELIPGIRR
jgi:predicted nucleic acid-binding protein